MRRQDKKGLGRGLSALLADSGQSGDEADTPTPRADATLPIDRLRPNPDQPRRQFGAQDLADLAASIAEKGIIQPLIVRPSPDHPGTYQIVAGERRWRAAQQAKLHDVPVVIRDLSDSEVLELAIIENIQRADLNPVEEAMGYRQLMDRFGHTQEKIAAGLGKSRSHIANLLRLLHLPEPVLEMLREGQLTSGHARALITSDSPVDRARDVIARGLSVRQTEQLVKQPVQQAHTMPVRPQKDADTRALESDLSAQLRMNVTITHSQNEESGEIRIRYKSLEQLDGLCQLLSQ